MTEKAKDVPNILSGALFNTGGKTIVFSKAAVGLINTAADLLSGPE